MSRVTTANDPPSLHLNAKQLAASLGKKRLYVTAMKGCGYKFEFATTTTLAHAEAWLRQHPEFRTTTYFAAHRGGVSRKKRQKV